MNWPTSSPWTSGVDAVLDYSSSKLYLFSGSQYARFDRAAGEIESGYPKALPGGFKNWPSSWTSVDAALRWTNDKLYLFRGAEYLRLTGTTVDSGYPRPISGNWDIHYTSGFDYGFVYPNGKAYFFKGSEYVRVRIDGNVESVDAGYPKQIVGRWPGVPF